MGRHVGDSPGVLWPWMKRRALEAAGWLLVAAGLAALVLPGPGLLLLVGGLALLAVRYAWAQRLLRPVKAKAFRVAAHGVQTWPRIVFSVLGGLALIVTGIVWGVGTPVPGWWPIGHRWWLLGGWGTGATLSGSGVFVLALIVYSYRRFRKPTDDVTARAGHIQRG
jgi:hypothetical protein